MSRKPKILLRVRAFPKISETFITNHIVMMLQNGFDVCVLVRNKRTVKNSTQRSLIIDYDLLNKTHEFKYYNISTLYKKITFVFKAVLSSKVFFKYLKTFNYFKYGIEGLKGTTFYTLYQLKDYLNSDIFHVQFGVNHFPFVELKKKNLIRQKLILTLHGFDVHYTKETFNEVKRAYKDAFCFSDVVTVNTQYLKQRIVALGCEKTKIEVMPMPVDTDYFRPLGAKINRKIKLLSVGRFVKFKGFEYGIRAVSELVKKGFDVYYEIIGEGEEQYVLEREIALLKLQRHVTLTGVGTQGYIKEKLQESDIFLMTSVADYTGRRETQGVVTIEAQACGLPVVGFNSGGVPYTIVDGETGYLCEEYDVERFANKIEYLILNEEERRQMGVNARTFVLNNYSNAKLKKQWKQLYNEILS